MRTKVWTWAWGILLGVVGAARAESPFGVAFTPRVQDGKPALEVRITIPPKHHIYADMLSVQDSEGRDLPPLDVPPPEVKYDPLSEAERGLYASDITALYALPADAGPRVVVNLQGCDDAVCFLPETHTFSLPGAGETAGPPAQEPASTSVPAWHRAAERFRVTARGEGFLKPEPFLALLNGETGAAATGEGVALAEDNLLARKGWFLTLLIILVGGVALNLTPCVLPMIPINLAIIGAGAQAGSKARGFLLGGAYGLAMALAYGALGLVVVLTGSTFGSLNASPWFNAVIAVVFVVLALGMFDVLHIDFTGLQNKFGAPGAAPRRGGSFWLAFIMGMVAALLAGACVAPVLISVLVLAGTLYKEGSVLALLLPFVLGLGMGLPWPFAGAGLSFLPKPGAWMNKVKTLFGVLILAFAAYYGHLAYSLFRAAPQDDQTAALQVALARAEAEGKPVFIDFWATWCKNCIAMEKTTFLDERVAVRLKDFVVVKFQAEKPNESPAREVLAYFQAKGLPTYVILTPGDK